MSGLRTQPVSRPKVLLGALVAFAVVAGLVGLSEWLRPGTPAAEGALLPEPDADPRIAVPCEEPEAREGQRRGDTEEFRPARAIEVDSNALYDCPTTWDGRRVRFQGEVVGAVLQRDEHAWLQLNDDVYATDLGPLPAHRDFRGGNAGVGVLIPRQAVRGLSVVGGPRTHGDIVRVVGTYHRVDDDSREVAVIRAQTVEVVRRGSPVPQPVERERVLVAAGAALLAGALLAAEWWQRRRGLRR